MTKTEKIMTAIVKETSISKLQYDKIKDTISEILKEREK